MPAPYVIEVATIGCLPWPFADAVSGMYVQLLRQITSTSNDEASLANGKTGGVSRLSFATPSRGARLHTGSEWVLAIYGANAFAPYQGQSGICTARHKSE